MKLLIVSQYFYPENFNINDFALALVSKGHDVTVLTGQPNYPDGEIYDGYANKKAEDNYHGVRIIRTKIRPRKTGSLNLARNYYSFWINSKRCVKSIKEEFDLVIVWQLSPVFMIDAGLLYKKIHHKKLICYCLDIWPESLKTRGVKESWPFVFSHYKKISKRLYSGCDRVYVTSPSFKKYLCNELGLDPGKIEYLPQFYRPRFEIDDGIQKDSNRFIYAGNIGKAQKIENVIMAFKDTNAVFDCYGSGSQYKFCKELVEKEHIDNVYMNWRVSKEELKSAYEKADYAVLPLSDKTLIGNTVPVKLQEYLYYKKPVLAAIKGDSRDIVTALQFGEVCDLDSIDSMKESINNMIAKKEKYNASEIEVEKYVKKNYDINRFIDKFLSDC